MKYAWIIAAVLAGSTALQPGALAQEIPAPQEQEFVSLLRQSTNQLEAAKTISAKAYLDYDVVQASGRVLRFSADYMIKAVRPDKFFTSITGDDGHTNQLYYNGAEIVIVNETDKLFARFPHQGDIDSAIDAALTEINGRMPLSILLRQKLGESLEDLFDYQAYVGARKVRGKSDNHLLLSNPNVDLQLWLDSDKYKLNKTVITYKTEEAKPQYGARFEDWTFDAPIDAQIFNFVPGEGFDEITLLNADDQPEK